MTCLRRKTELSLFMIAFAFLLGGFAVNTTFLILGIHGYLRELSRLTTIIGLLLVVVGLAQAIYKMIFKSKPTSDANKR